MTSRAAEILRSVVIALFLAVLWCWVIAPPPDCPHFFEAEIKSAVPGSARVSYNRGAGWRDSEAAEQQLRRTDQWVPVRLPLLPGKYQAMRFQPSDRPGSVQFRNARIATFDDRTVHRFSLASFWVDDSVARLRETDRVVFVETKSGVSPAVLSLTFDPPLRLGVGVWANASLQAPRFVLATIISLALLRGGARIWRRRSSCAAWLRDYSGQHPRRALAACALAATVAASYPVVFFGKSFVSPQNSGPLLYENSPTVPGFNDPDVYDAHGADTGAMMWQHLPYAVQQSRALRQGTLPLWNRANSAGVTLLGQGQSMFGDPFHLIVLAAGGASWAFDVKFLLAKALFACGLAWIVWAMTRDFAASAIVSLASAFIAFFNFRFNHPAIFSLCYSPWVLVAWFQICDAKTRREFMAGLVGWFVANAVLLASGTVKEAYLLGLTLNVTGVLIFRGQPCSWATKARSATYVGLATCALLLATSPLWWTFLQALATAYTAYDVPSALQNRPEWFIGLFDDLFYRELMPGHQVYQPAANFLMLLGVVCALQQPRRLFSNRAATVLLIVAGLAICCAFQIGPNGGTGRWLLHVPFLRNIYHLNNVFSCVAIVHLLALAGWGYSVARQPLAQGHATRLALRTAGVVAVLLIPYFLVEPPDWTAGHPWHFGRDVSWPQAILYVHVGLLPLALAVLLWAAGRQLRRQPVGAGMVLAVALALVVLLGRHGQHLPLTTETGFLVTPGKRTDLLARSPAVEFLQRELSGEPGRVIGTGANFFPGFATVYGLEGINGPNALENARYRELTEAGGMATPGDWRFEMSASALPQWRALLDFLNVRFVSAPVEAMVDPPGYERVARTDFDVFRSSHAWPRAFFSSRIETYTTPADLVHLIRTRPPGEPFAAMQAGEPLPSVVTSVGSNESRTTVPARDYLLEPNRTTFTLVAPSAGVAVLHETWLADDFRATVDGRAVPYFRVNHAFKGIVLPAAGTYRIAFSYWPRDFTLTLWLSAAGVILFVLLCVSALRCRTSADGG
ncbi:MAG: hypothetical protein ABIZ04_05770 [Opitutus sp.]